MPLYVYKCKTCEDVFELRHSYKDKINKLTSSYRSKTEYFVDKLAEGIARITASFYPKENFFFANVIAQYKYFIFGKEVQQSNLKKELKKHNINNF